MPRLRLLLFMLSLGWVGATHSADLPSAKRASVLLLFDSSKSMLEKIDGISKFQLGRRAVEYLLAPKHNSDVAIATIGGHPENSCQLFDPILPSGSRSSKTVLRSLDRLHLAGDASLLFALKSIVSDVTYGNVTRIIFVSSGSDSCSLTSCSELHDFAVANTAISIDVIGFGKEDVSAFPRCVADLFAGQYLDVHNLRAIALLLEKPDPIAELVRCSVDVPFRRAHDCQFSVTYDGREHIYRIGGDVTPLRSPPISINETTLLRSAKYLDLNQISSILNAASMYAGIQTQVALGGTLGCAGIHDNRFQTQADAFKLPIASHIAALHIACGGEDQNWATIATRYLSRLTARPCDGLNENDLSQKEELIDANVWRQGYLADATGVQGAALRRELLMFAEHIKDCSSGRHRLNQQVILNSPMRSLYLRMENGAITGDFGGAVRSEPVDTVYDAWALNGAKTATEMEQFCDIYDPPWRGRVNRDPEVDIAKTPPGCILYDPKGGSGAIRNTGGSLYSGYGTLILSEGARLDLGVDYKGTALFVNLHIIDALNKIKPISFPVFFGVTGDSPADITELYSFHFVARIDPAEIRRRIRSAPISPNAKMYYVADGDGDSQESRDVIVDAESVIDPAKVESALHVSTTGLLGVPWRHLGSVDDVCSVIETVRSSKRDLLAVYDWNAAMVESNIGQKREYCGDVSGPECLSRVMRDLDCERARSPSQRPLADPALRLDAKKLLVEQPAQ